VRSGQEYNCTHVCGCINTIIFNLEQLPSSRQPSQYIIAKSKRHAGPVITCQKSNQIKGYLDAKDGDVGAGDAWYAVLEPQAVGLLQRGVSNMVLVLVEHGKSSYPCDVVVRVHDTAHRINDENQHEDQPIGKVIQSISLHVGRDEGTEGDESRGLL
jgi:hypothetical protein